jgi:hypothetical protein
LVGHAAPSPQRPLKVAGTPDAVVGEESVVVHAFMLAEPLVVPPSGGMVFVSARTA